MADKEYGGVDFDSNDTILGVDDAIPIIDYSKLTSNDPHQSSQAVEFLGKICLEYGFFA
ncbi:putative Leucoanthocyanidin dioxygenase, partial [Corchorus olitorius]